MLLTLLQSLLQKLITVVILPTKITWVDPTTNADGSPITSGEITAYEIGVRLASGTVGVYTSTASVAPTETSELLSALTPALPLSGSFEAAVRAVTTSGASSWSVEVPFTISALPNPPNGVVVA